MLSVVNIGVPPAIVTIASSTTHFRPCPQYHIFMPVSPQKFNIKGTVIGMSASVLVADFQCKHNDQK